MNVKTYCPCCGALTTVQLTFFEARDYELFGKVPFDFYERIICQCCLDDGYKLSIKGGLVYGI